MDDEMKLAELMKQAERNANELDRMLEAMRDLGDLPVAFSRDALVDELGFGVDNTGPIALPTGAMRA